VHVGVDEPESIFHGVLLGVTPWLRNPRQAPWVGQWGL
jgi:hypothetical protein